jgi:RNA polymerase sigma-70 factor (ECF subfamily)
MYFPGRSASGCDCARRVYADVDTFRLLSRKILPNKFSLQALSKIENPRRQSRARTDPAESTMGNVVRHLQQRWTRARFARQTEHWLPALYRTARRLTHDPAAAEDLVHDAYLKAYQAFDRADLDSAEACRGWLFRILVNTYRDSYRRQQRSPEVQSVAPEQAMDASASTATGHPASDPEVLLAHKHFAAAAQAAMATLSPEVRLVVTLFFVEGFAYKEIADLAGCPMGTVMSRLARGRRILQHHLREHRYPHAGATAVPQPRRSMPPTDGAS